MSIWAGISEQIAVTTGRPFNLERHRSVGGGCINSAYVIEGDGQSYFVKTNRSEGLEMFAAEAAGLEEIAGAEAVRVPKPTCHGLAGETAFLVMERLEMGSGGSGSIERLGRGLARMHRTTQEQYGWWRDNTIGSTHQPNEPSNDWCDFWQRHRLGYQLELAARNGYGGSLLRKGERLMADLHSLLADYSPAASLLHGDLWSGNYAVTTDGEPVIFDPAVYYGDREADLAMTELFGGFPSCFYQAYGEEWPLDPGYGQRKSLYNLYHILNHLNLFGGGYLSQAEAMVEHLLSEIR